MSPSSDGACDGRADRGGKNVHGHLPGHLDIPDIYIVDRLELIKASGEKQGVHIRECDDVARPDIPDGEFRVILPTPWLRLDMKWRRTRRVRPFI
jgi:hypothetical protein